MREAVHVGPWIRRFLLEHLVSDRNLSVHTRRSYRDALVILLPFAAERCGRAVDQLLVTDLSTTLLKAFLTHLESVRKCSIATRNQRLAAVHSLARFIAQQSPEHIEWCSQVRQIPSKRAPRPAVGYLDKPELDALLAAPDRSKRQGERDYALLLFLYNTGSRADEAAQLLIRDLALDSASVRILGKGTKTRICPLWPKTVSVLRALIGQRAFDERVFLNRRREPMTRYGVYGLVERYADSLRRSYPDLAARQISPHTIRHTTACHLLRSGVDINTIRGWLGHVSLETTNIYAEVDLEMKAKALARCDIGGSDVDRRWKKPQILAFLQSL